MSQFCFQRELKEFIPRLLKIVTGREDVWHSRRSAKPDWWPAGVDWAMGKADWLSKVHVAKISIFH